MLVPDRYALGTIGVALRRIESIDIALPGRRLGLGLGEPSVPDDIDCSDAEYGNAKASASVSMGVSMLVLVNVPVLLVCMPALESVFVFKNVFVTDALIICVVVSSKRSSLRTDPSADERGVGCQNDAERMLLYDDARGRPNSSLLIISPLASAEKAESGGGGSIPDFSCRRRRGFFPLSRTRALIPTRLTSWCIASQSEIGRACTLHRVLVTRIVLGGTIPDAVRPGRAGVTKGQLCTAAFAVKGNTVAPGVGRVIILSLSGGSVNGSPRTLSWP